MAAPVFATGSSAINTRTVNKPSSVASGDLLVLAVVTYDTDPVSVTLSGWTRRVNNQFGAKDGGANAKTWLTVLDRVADGSEGATFTVSMTGTPYTDLMCGRYTGAIASPFDTSASDGTTNATTTASAPSVTTTTADEILIIVHGGYNAPGLSAAYTGFSTNIGPIDTVNYMFSKSQATAATVGPFTTTQSSTGYTTATLAYKSTAGSTPVSDLRPRRINAAIMRPRRR